MRVGVVIGLSSKVAWRCAVRPSEARVWSKTEALYLCTKAEVGLADDSPVLMSMWPIIDGSENRVVRDFCWADTRHATLPL